ncbi:DUF2231 domain-containing protein [Luteococcus peritonei]|uniref:DUF2231 domain-containing protein n=1 Tax=Luteococcus peritonei TaxID=88874 RepID=A0ABW4RW75_9ACTN
MPATDSPLSSAMLGLENTQALDPGVRAAQPLMDAVTANPTVRDALQGRWLGHALHPLMVMVPLGSWLSASVLDAAGTDQEGSSTELLTALGVLTAVPSALTGLAELAEAGTREKRVGLVHAATNVVGLGLQVASWAARRSGQDTRAKLLAAAGLSAVGAGGYLGGHLSVAREVGSKDRAFERTAAG